MSGNVSPPWERWSPALGPRATNYRLLLALLPLARCRGRLLAACTRRERERERERICAPEKEQERERTRVRRRDERL